MWDVGGLCRKPVTMDEGNGTKDVVMKIMKYLAVNISAVTNTNNMNHMLLDIDFVYDPVITFAQRIATFFASGQRFAPERTQ